MSNELTTKEANLQLPAYLKNEEKLGLEELANFVIPPRVKFVQKSSAGEVVEQFGLGSAIAAPQNVLLAVKDEPLIITPIFFYPEWIYTNPPGKKPFIIQRTIDEQDSLVAKCKDPKMWRHVEKVGDEEIERRYTECLNFVCIIHNAPEELKDTPIVFTFSKAEHRTGSDLCSKIRMRRGPICANRFVFTIGLRPGDVGDWYGFDIHQPGEEAGGAFIADANQYAAYKQLHEQYKQLHEDKLLQVTYDEEANTESEVSTDEINNAEM